MQMAFFTDTVPAGGFFLLKRIFDIFLSNCCLVFAQRKSKLDFFGIIWKCETLLWIIIIIDNYYQSTDINDRTMTKDFLEKYVV